MTSPDPTLMNPNQLPAERIPEWLPYLGTLALLLLATYVLLWVLYSFTLVVRWLLWERSRRRRRRRQGPAAKWTNPYDRPPTVTR